MPSARGTTRTKIATPCGGRHARIRHEGILDCSNEGWQGRAFATGRRCTRCTTSCETSWRFSTLKRSSESVWDRLLREGGRERERESRAGSVAASPDLLHYMPRRGGAKRARRAERRSHVTDDARGETRESRDERRQTAGAALPSHHPTAGPDPTRDRPRATPVASATSRRRRRCRPGRGG